MKKGIGERIAEITEIPKDYIMNLPRITILGTKEVYVDNYKGLLEYSHELIRLATTNKIIIIKGTGLIITRIVEDAVFVGGNIISVEFSTKNKKVGEINKTQDV